MMYKNYVYFLIFFLFLPFLANSNPIDSLLNALTKAKEDTNKVLIFKELCWQYRKIDQQKSLDFGQKGIALAEELNFETGKADLMCFMGVNYVFYAAYSQGNEWFLKSLQIAEKINYTQCAAFSYDNLGVIAYYQQQYEKASLYFQKALKKFEKINNQKGIAYALTHQNWVYTVQGKYDEAIFCSLKAYELRLQYDTQESASNALHDIGKTFYVQKKYGEALRYLHQALELATKSKKEIAIADHAQLLGEVYFKINDLPKAFEYTTQSLTIAEKYSQKKLTMSNAKTLFEIYNQLKDYPNALHYQGIYYTLKNELFNEEVNRKTAEADAKYQYEKNEKEYLEKNMKSEKEISNQRWIIYVGVLVILFMFGLFYVVYLNRKRQLQLFALLKTKNEEIHHQSEKLQESNQLKDKLFSIISHDLRSPLGVLHQILELTAEDLVSETELKTILPELAKNVEYASNLLDNLLVWAKNQMHNADPQPEIFDIKIIAQSQVNLFQKQAKDKGIVLENHIRVPCSVYADINMIDLVLRNLVSNAVKFCNEGATIYITAEKQNALVRVSVQDTGVGIAPDKIEGLFGKNYFTTRGTKDEKGTGLGLMLCKEFIAKNGGNIWVESQVNEGSKFIFTLPAKDFADNATPI